MTKIDTEFEYNPSGCEFLLATADPSDPDAVTLADAIASHHEEWGEDMEYYSPDYPLMTATPSMQAGEEEHWEWHNCPAGKGWTGSNFDDKMAEIGTGKEDDVYFEYLLTYCSPRDADDFRARRAERREEVEADREWRDAERAELEEEIHNYVPTLTPEEEARQARRAAATELDEDI